MWMPRDPEVFGQPTSPTASSDSLQTIATSRICGQATPGTGSRSIRSSSGMVQVVGADRVRIEVDAAEVDDPDQGGRLVDHDLVGGAPGRERQLGGPDPVGRVVRRPLLEERLLGDAIDEPLEGHRPATDAGQRPFGDGQVEVDDIELGEARVGEVDLLRVRDRDLAAADLEGLLGRRHARTIPPPPPRLGPRSVENAGPRSSSLRRPRITWPAV